MHFRCLVATMPQTRGAGRHPRSVRRCWASRTAVDTGRLGTASAKLGPRACPASVRRDCSKRSKLQEHRQTTATHGAIGMAGSAAVRLAYSPDLRCAGHADDALGVTWLKCRVSPQECGIRGPSTDPDGVFVTTPRGWLPVALQLCTGHYTRALELGDDDQPTGTLRLGLTSQKFAHLLTCPPLARARREHSSIVTLASRESAPNTECWIGSPLRSQVPV